MQRTLHVHNDHLLISVKIGLFSKFLQVTSFLQVEVASQKDNNNCKSCIPAFIEKFYLIWVEIAPKK